MSTFLGKLKQNPAIEAQGLHVCLGALAIVLPAYFGISPWWGFGIWESFAIYLEAWVDPRNEDNAPFFWDGALDLAFYNVGMASGRGLIALHGILP